jgi:hypothetical protein
MLCDVAIVGGRLIFTPDQGLSVSTFDARRNVPSVGMVGFAYCHPRAALTLDAYKVSSHI